MGDSFVTIIAIFLAAILMFVFPLMSISERTDDVSQLSVQTATTEFVDKVRTTGKLTLDDYDKYVQTITSTGNSFEVSMQAQILDENPGVKTTQAETTKIGENVYYNLYNSENNGCILSTPKLLFGGTIGGVKTAYYNIFLQNKTPAILPNFSYENKITAYVECGIAINQNSDKKDKTLRFIEYCLSEDVQEYWCGSRSDKGFSGTNEISLPVNNKAFDYAVEVETGEEWDYNEDGEFDEEEKEFSENVDSIFWKYYLGIIDDISGCTLYNYKNLKTTYYNSSVIGDIVDKYLKGDISKDKFIRQLSAATEIYLTE